MACNTLKNALEHFRNNNLIGDLRTIAAEDYTAVENETKRLQKLLEDKYGVSDKFFEVAMIQRPTVSNRGNFTIFRLNFNSEAFKKLDTVVDDFNFQETASKADANGQLSLFSDVLNQATAIAENTYNGEVYDTKEKLEQAKKEIKNDIAFAPYTSQNGPTNYASIINYKETVLKGVEKRISNTEAKRKYDKSPEIKVDLAKLKDLKLKLETDLYDLHNDPDIFEKTMSIFNKDVSLIDNILSRGTPSVENIHFAEDIINYFDVITDYSSTNTDNDFVDVKNTSNIDPLVKEGLNKLRSKILDQKTKLQTAKEAYLIKAIDESQKLKSMFPNKQLEEIKEMLLSPKKDISLISLLFGTVEEDFSGNETLLASLVRKELEDSRNKNKSFASGLIQSINFLQNPVKKKLIAMGYGLSIKGLNSLVSEVNYDLFYQKTNKGNKTGRLVNKFSHSWFSNVLSFTRNNADAIKEAFLAQDYSAVNQALVDKYHWLNDNADFIQLGKLPEIISNPDFSHYSASFDLPAANQYKKDLIAKIGQYEYNKIVQMQTEYVEDYNLLIREELSTVLASHGVNSPADLPQEAIDNFNKFAKRHSPFEFINSHNIGQQGRVDYVTQGVGAQYQSHLKYNTYIPKQKVERVAPDASVYTVDSEYYDKDFNTIEQDSDLMEFWEVMSEATIYMNSTLSDANTTLGHNSLPKMKQSTTDLLLNKNVGVLGKTSSILRETGQTLKNLVSSSKTSPISDDVSEVSKGNMETIQADVNARQKVITMQLSTLLGRDLSGKAKIDLGKASIEVQQIFEKVTNRNIQDIINDHGTAVSPNILKEYLTNQVMEEQTFNLPVMMRAYLDMVSEYKAQKEALPEISIYKGLYDGLKMEKKNSKLLGMSLPDVSIRDMINRNRNKTGLEDKRWMAQLRMKSWVNKNVKGVTDKESWGKLGGTNYTAEEKKFKKTAEEYLDSLNTRLANTTDPDEHTQLSNEIDEVQNAIDNLGKVYTLSAIYETLINRASVFVGLGFNIKAQIANRFQGWWQGMINDTGRYWPQGAFYAANAFINRKGLRRLPGNHKYRNEIKKTRLLIEKLNTLQDATNELDRAKRDSGIRGKTKMLNPYYLIEYTEWHNQVPQILSVLSGQTITDKNGNSIPIFNGDGFPAFNIQKGHLVLKPEFDTEENRASWVDFSNQESSDLKTKISQTIATLNGDYSKTGGTFVKRSAVGRTLMMFKTWLPKQIMLRFGLNQTDLATGIKDYDGAYTGGLKSGKTRTAATAALTGMVGVTATMGLGLGFAIPMGLGLIGYTTWNNYKDKKDGENLQTMKQLSLAGKALLRKSLGLPINTLLGKNLIKDQDFSSLNLTEGERQNFQFIVNELTGLLYLTLMKVMMKSMSGDDEDDEPKTIYGQPNPYYGKEKPSAAEKAVFFLAENTLTKLIGDATLLTNPNEVFKTMFHPAGAESWFTKVEAVSDGLSRLVTTGDDTLASGPNAGKSKLGESLKNMSMPGIFNEWTQGDLGSFGFAKQMEKDMNPGEIMDAWYKSDYAKDRKTIKAERADKKEELTTYWQKEFDYNNLQEEEKLQLDPVINKIINQELNAELSSDIRGEYDEHQKKIE